MNKKSPSAIQDASRNIVDEGAGRFLKVIATAKPMSQIEKASPMPQPTK